MWARLYEHAATTERKVLLAALSALERCDRPAVLAAWEELGFSAKLPRSRTEAVERISRKVLQRHDTYVRVNL